MSGVGGRPPSSANAADPEANVLVDLGIEHDPQRVVSELRSLRGELDKANTNYEREVADGKRLRAEAMGLRDRICLLYTSPSPRDGLLSRMPSSA